MRRLGYNDYKVFGVVVGEMMVEGFGVGVWVWLSDIENFREGATMAMLCNFVGYEGNCNSIVHVARSVGIFNID